jgi:Protein of unknown function (DUF3995)
VTLAISLALFASLAAIAALHAYWAKGGAWPARDAGGLAEYVIGAPGRPGMPPAGITWMTSAALAATALDGLALGFRITPAIDRLATWAGVGFVGVFAVRGVAGYTKIWRSAHPGEIFALLDRRFYSPFCILVAEGFFTLVSERL